MDRMQSHGATKKPRSNRPSEPKQSTGKNSVDKKEVNLNLSSATLEQINTFNEQRKKDKLANELTRIQLRRQQVRLAQRAYRARNEAQTRALQQRVARLESALERTSQAMISFTDVLVGTQVLPSHQQLAHRLRDTVKTCLNLAMYGEDCATDAQYSRTPEPSPIADITTDSEARTEREHNEQPLSNEYAGLGMLSYSPLLPFVSGSSTVIEVPTFVNRLRITCLYQGFLLLNNPTVPLEALKRPFRLLLSLVTRETITSYFHACLYARLNNKQPDRYSCIPCFKLGGAGTHYPEAGFEQEVSPMIYNALSAFSPEAQKDLDGEWFDVFDLLGYLRARKVALYMVPPVKDSTYRTVNAINFMAGETFFFR
ncbi:hypothetical protein N7478_004056 [Penicillium angulare]|uniref:uncharacterized protein n=1 Tax=Penicillium angulare TaxID=116970 RepID=UPI002541C982|nr:uncharacterized protein N7478_004056 [Penicillium angulare]KAJ5278684.1 hypothetical protein N7478_004056 [Penicillium angulare]